jgi:DNA-directed RNA polymerase specialized sigma24 family protein
MGLEEQDAFEALAADARSRLWRAFVAVRGVDGADEAVSEALAWAWEHRERLISMVNPVGYLYRVGLTRSTPRAAPLLPAPREVGMPDVEPGLLPALLALPESQRAAVWLVHGCGWTYAEVADALQIGRSTVGTHTSRAMRALRRQLEVTVHG